MTPTSIADSRFMDNIFFPFRWAVIISSGINHFDVEVMTLALWLFMILVLGRCAKKSIWLINSWVRHTRQLVQTGEYLDVMCICQDETRQVSRYYFSPRFCYIPSSTNYKSNQFINSLLDGVIHVFFVLVFSWWSVATPVFVSLRTLSRSPW